MADPIEILDFWLGDVGAEGWYAGTPEIDDACREFEPVLEALASDGLEHWVEGTVGTLAYLIVADQFSRNVYRGQAQAFATDAKALAAAKRAVEEGWDLGAPEPERQFFYLPFEHSEDPNDQEMAVNLMETRMPESPMQLLHARAHQETIRRFGRFPGRNEALGRENTPEEAEFQAQGGYAALVQSLSA